MNDDTENKAPEETQDSGENPTEKAAEQAVNEPENLAFEEIEEEADEGDDDLFDPKDYNEVEKDLTAIYDIPVQISAVLGRSSMLVSQLLKLGRGAVVELDRRVGEPIDIYVNNRLVARGEVVVEEDRLGITMTEIVKAENN